ncbi:MAG: hypothetical protein Kow0031_39890 [Anaerolineae bacterium]
MAAKSTTSIAPTLLRNQQYFGTFSTMLYNWPIFAACLGFGAVALVVSTVLAPPWSILLAVAGGLALLLLLTILIGSFVAYDWGRKREYHRLVELADAKNANVVIDITAGKLRGTRGLLQQIEGGHYFVVDIFDSEKMTDTALRRARQMEPPLDTDRRIYRRAAKPGSLPIPHNWADVVYCSFSLHELQSAEDRAAIFAEFARVLKPGGKLLIAEHSRDWLNTLAFGPGVLSFLPASTWKSCLDAASFTVTHHERWRGLVHLWVAEKSKDAARRRG